MAAKPPPQSQVLLALARDAGVECWATPTGDPYCTVAVGEHREHHRLGSKASRDYLARLYYEQEEKAPNAQALQDALGVLRGEALWGGSERIEVHVRHAAFDDAIYIDLGDPDWRAVEVDPHGWRIVTDPPVRFRRPRGLLPLPEPERGARLDSILRELLNLDGDAWRLVAGWLVGSLAPSGPYPILALHGEQGAAKSSAARLLRGLIDPNIAPLRSEPKDERDLVIAASNGRIVALDNLSHLPPSLSDALCRLATGGGFATRELYSDAEEVIFCETRPAIITGIGDVATRGDLIDRTIAVTLEPIGEDARLTEAALEQRFADRAPHAFGALLTAASTALQHLPEVSLQRLPRMADHAKWVEAAAPAFGWEPGEHLEVYAEARQAAVETALDASPVTEPIRTVAVGGWEGTATELLAELEGIAGEQAARARSWPKSARGLGNVLRRLAPDLRANGIEVEEARVGEDRRRGWRIDCSAPNPPEVPDPPDPAFQSGSEAGTSEDETARAGRNGPEAGTSAGTSEDGKCPPANGSGMPDSEAAGTSAGTSGTESSNRSTSGCASHPDGPVHGCRYCSMAAEAA